jgi:hypothetical protein
VAARLALPGADHAAILEGEELRPGKWEAAHARWLGEISEELDRGKQKLLSAYDTAYVAALEEARGPITPEEYARLTVAIERGRGEAKLREMDLPEESLMGIRRVWLERMVKDPKLGAKLRAATRTAREE